MVSWRLLDLPTSHLAKSITIVSMSRIVTVTIVLKGEDAYHLGGKPSRHLVVQLYAEILPK